MLFLTVVELADKYKCSQDSFRRQISFWIKQGDLVDAAHYRRRAINRGMPSMYPREFNDRVIAMLIVRDREKKHCKEAFVNGYVELMKTLR